MKKLRVILPAILTLAVSTSAAVTGTVAWFTATRLKTVTMNNVSVVDPEQGLNLELVEGIAGVIVDEDTVDPDTHIPEDGVTPIIKQATYDASGEKVGHFRDGSVDVVNGKVYKGVLDDSGNQPTTFAEVASDYRDVTRTYDDLAVFHATAFKLTFSVEDNSSEIYAHSLFLDLNASTANLNATGAGDDDEKLYKALRIGLISGDEWFVWAPFTNLTAANASYIGVDAEDSDDDSDNTELLPLAYDAANWTNENNTNTGANSAITEAAGTGYITSAAGTGINYVGYLGELAQYEAGSATLKGTEVTVYTWFEGTDENCRSEYFEHALPGVQANLKFVMRKVAR